MLHSLRIHQCLCGRVIDHGCGYIFHILKYGVKRGPVKGMSPDTDQNINFCMVVNNWHGLFLYLILVILSYEVSHGTC